MLISFFRIIFYALLIYVILKLFRLFQKPTSPGRRSVENQARSQGIMVKDEICDVYLPKDEAIKTIFQGKEYYFCSEKCKQKFLESHIKH